MDLCKDSLMGEISLVIKPSTLLRSLNEDVLNTELESAGICHQKPPEDTWSQGLGVRTG